MPQNETRYHPSTLQERQSNLYIGTLAHEFDTDNLHALINNTTDLMWSVDLDYRLINANNAFQDLIKHMTGRHMLKGDCVLETGFTNQQVTKYKELYDRAYAGSSFKITEYTDIPVELWTELSFYPIHNGKEVTGTACYSHNITDRKKSEHELRMAEEKLIHANRIYSFLSQINKTIIRSDDQQTVFSEACRIAVETGKFEVAWIGEIDRVRGTISLVEAWGMTATDKRAFENVRYAPDGIVATILQTGQHAICPNIVTDKRVSAWSTFAAAHPNWRSCIALPIKKRGEIVGTFNLICSKTDFFDTAEVSLLKEAADDISFALDVFEKEHQRKEMEKKAVHSELRLKQAQAIAHVGSWVIDFTTGLGTWSEETCRIYGLAPEDNIQTYAAWLSYVHPEDFDRVNEINTACAQTFSPSAIHHRIVRKDGAIRHVFSQAHFELNELGQPVGMYGVTHDETATKNAEEALAQSEANLRLIMDLIPQSIFARDAEGKYLFVNKSFASMYDISPEQMENNTVENTIPLKSEMEYFLKQDREVISSGNPKLIPDHPFTDLDGNKRSFQTLKVPFTIAGTTEKAVLGITTDITIQKQTDEDREKMIADIVKRNKDLEQFSYIVSHNLRAPVANIAGIAEILQIADLPSADKTLFTNELGGAVSRLDDVIIDLNNILQVNHKGSRKKELVNFSDLISNITSGIDDQIKNEDAQVRCNFEACGELLTVKSQLYSVFFNLITNSIKYRQPGVKPVLEIRSEWRNNKAILTFADNGLGIDLDKRGHQIFGLYKRFHNHVEGKGMGLFMVKTHVEALGGKIEVASEVNAGTTFTLEFDINKN